MAINQNHTFEDLDGVKCAIVEKGVTSERSWFLKELLEFNGFTVVIVQTPVKAVAKPVAAADDEKADGPTLIETFTVGVTDITFNPINAIFGRQLYTPGGRVVTPAYWQQKESVSRDDVPYFQKR